MCVLTGSYQLAKRPSVEHSHPLHTGIIQLCRGEKVKQFTPSFSALISFPFHMLQRAISLQQSVQPPLEYCGRVPPLLNSVWTLIQQPASSPVCFRLMKKGQKQSHRLCSCQSTIHITSTSLYTVLVSILCFEKYVFSFQWF